MNFFITGSDTEVGKTFVTCLLIKALRDHGFNAVGFKPVASGVDRFEGSDGFKLWKASDAKFDAGLVSPQRFRKPVSPALAAFVEQKSIDRQLLVDSYHALCRQSDAVLVEGAGGILSPMDSTWSNADMAAAWSLPALIVVPDKLGAVNQSLLSIEAAANRSIPILGLVLNQSRPDQTSSIDFRNAEQIRGQLEAHAQAVPTIYSLQYEATKFPDVEMLIEEYRAIRLRR